MSDIVKTSNVGGKPTDYYHKVKPFLNNVREWVKQGCIYQEIADNLKIDISTLYSYQNRFPEFKEALKDHWKEAIDITETALKTRAVGYDAKDYKEVEEEYWVVDKKTKIPYRVLDENGNPLIIKRKETITKHIPADTRAATFVLMNKAKKDWQYITASNNINIQNNNTQVNNTLNINTISDEDLDKKISQLIEND